MFLLNKSYKGYVALITVLVVGAVSVVIVVSLILLGISSSRASFALEQSNQAKALANACAEEALQQIRNSTPFTGSGEIEFDQGLCYYLVTSQGGQNRTVTAQGIIQTIERKVKVVIGNITPSINIISWKEVEEF